MTTPNINTRRMRGSACKLTVYENGFPFGPMQVNNATYNDGSASEDVDEVGQDVPLPDGYIGESPKFSCEMSPTTLGLKALRRARQKNKGNPAYANYKYAIKAEWNDKMGNFTVELVDCILFDHSVTVPPGTTKVDQNFTVAGREKETNAL